MPCERRVGHVGLVGKSHLTRGFPVGARSLELWRQLERLDGPALISIPAPVRTEMLRQAAGTLAAATMAASASYSLVGADLRQDHTTRGVARPESEAYPRIRMGPGPISPRGR